MPTRTAGMGLMLTPAAGLGLMLTLKVTPAEGLASFPFEMWWHME
jgi:hypothetical protein